MKVLYDLLGTLPDPENKSYDSVLRKIIDKLIRIQDELQWLSALTTIVEEVSVFTYIRVKQKQVIEALLSETRTWSNPSIDYSEKLELIIQNLEDWRRLISTEGVEMDHLQRRLTSARKSV